MHLHASAMDALVIWAMIMVMGLLWRTLSARWSDRPIGKAMAVIY